MALNILWGSNMVRLGWHMLFHGLGRDRDLHLVWGTSKGVDPPLSSKLGDWCWLWRVCDRNLHLPLPASGRRASEFSPIGHCRMWGRSWLRKVDSSTTSDMVLAL